LSLYTQPDLGVEAVGEGADAVAAIVRRVWLLQFRCAGVAGVLVISGLACQGVNILDILTHIRPIVSSCQSGDTSRQVRAGNSGSRPPDLEGGWLV